MEFLAALAPWAATVEGVVGIADGATVDILAPRLAGPRYLISVGWGNSPITVLLMTQGGVSLWRMYTPGEAVTAYTPRKVPDANNGLRLRNTGGGAIASVQFSIIYADPPFYVFTPALINQVTA